tara:strand:+ start:7166 stop:7999 length:834 start_codon:yes stop_codon:yes gene_type:complete
MSSKKTLIAGPWVGEFGWELFAWHAYIRALSKNFDKTVIIARNASFQLYNDFCDEFYGFNPNTGLADAFFMHNLDINRALKKVIQENKLSLKGCALAPPRRIGFPPNTHFTEEIPFGNLKIKPEYITFGSLKEKKYDYVFHIRDRELRKEDNWSLNKWEKLAFHLKREKDVKIACIGTKKESGWIEGTEDLRDIDLSETFDVLRNAKCSFGPSSGPMHLASLCGCPHVVWSKPENRTRYQTNWNPLSTPILFLDEFSWHPESDYVYAKFKQWKLNNK